MKLDIGSEDKFLEYVDRLGDSDVVALVSHIDMDGVGAALVANKALEADHLYFVNYDELTAELVKELRSKRVNKVVFTDLFLGQNGDSFISELEGFAEILVIDHHIAPHYRETPRTTYIKCENGYCAAYLCYELFSKIVDLSSYDWIVACASIADYCYEKNAAWMSEVFKKYHQRFNPLTLKQTDFWTIQWTISLALIYFRDNVRRVYDSIGLSFGEIGKLSQFSKKVQEELDVLLARFEKERKRIPGGYYWEFAPNYKLGGLVSSVISGREFDKKFVIVRIEGTYCFISARRQDKKENMVVLLQSAVEGLQGASAGGHIPAAGGHFLRKDLGTVKSRLGIST